RRFQNFRGRHHSPATAKSAARRRRGQSRVRGAAARLRQPKGTVPTGRASPARFGLGGCGLGPDPWRLRSGAEATHRLAAFGQRASNKIGPWLAIDSGRSDARRGSATQLLGNPQPIDGVVTERPLYAGDLATANQPILTVMNLSRLIAKCHIAQSDAALLKVGNPAELAVSGLDETIKGRVTLVSPALDPGSTTIEVWVEAIKANPALKPGMTVEVSMTAKTVKDALV